MQENIFERSVSDVLKIIISGTKRNKDDSVTVYWGYECTGSKALRVAPEDSVFQVTRGSIFLKESIPKLYHKGVHRNTFSTVFVDDDSAVEWNLMGQKISFSSKLLNMAQPA